MEKFPWWNDEQKKLADEIEAFVKEVVPLSEEKFWKREFPTDVMKMVAEKGYFGAAVAKEYGGMGLGVTGGCIVAEALAKAGGAVPHAYVVSTLGGLHQLKAYGSKEQKQKWLPLLAKGQLGAVGITEPYAGSDASDLQTTAKKEGDHYVMNGKKRFITGLGVADRYFVYAKTSNEPEKKKALQHLSAFIVEKGMPGFTVEKINELIGFDNMPNGYLDFDEVKVPEANRIGKEGDAWMILMTGLNFERTIGAAAIIGGMAEAVRYAVNYAQRRVQFGMRTTDFPTNQFKIAEMMAKLRMARLMTYYTAYAVDIGRDAILDATVAKWYASDWAVEVALESIQVMGGDGVTKFYPIERLLRDGKIGQIVAGTNEIMRYIMYRQGIPAMKRELVNTRRRLHPTLKVPIPVAPSKMPKPADKVDEASMMKLLADYYRTDPGIYLTMDDFKEDFAVKPEELEKVLVELEKKGLAVLFRDRKGRLLMARASLEGLKKANPKEYYKWIPSWIKPNEMF